MWLPVLLHGFFDFFALLAGVGGYWTLLLLLSIGIAILGGFLAYKKLAEVKKIPESTQFHQLNNGRGNQTACC
jgi:hypothetical protein